VPAKKVAKPRILKKSVILRGADGSIYQISSSDLRQYKVTRRDKKLELVKDALKSVQAAQSNTLCLQADFEDLRDHGCCARCVEQLRETLKPPSPSPKPPRK
jgi:hypothetical protein